MMKTSKHRASIFLRPILQPGFIYEFYPNIGGHLKDHDGPRAVSAYLLGNCTLFSFSRTRERVGVRVCHGLHFAQRGSLTLALSQREREMLILQKVACKRTRLEKSAE